MDYYSYFFSEQTKRQIFYSFHFGNDYWRTQIVRNIGAIEGNKPVSPAAWEEVKRNGPNAIRTWINNNMKMRSCVVVLVGEETANRQWVQYEITHAWETGKGVVGIYINNLRDKDGNKSYKGPDPFKKLQAEGRLPKDVDFVCYDPDHSSPYKDIEAHLSDLIEEAIAQRKAYGK